MNVILFSYFCIKSVAIFTAGECHLPVSMKLG